MAARTDEATVEVKLSSSEAKLDPKAVTRFDLEHAAAESKTTSPPSNKRPRNRQSLKHRWQQRMQGLQTRWQRSRTRFLIIRRHGRRVGVGDLPPFGFPELFVLVSSLLFVAGLVVIHASSSGFLQPPFDEYFIHLPVITTFFVAFGLRLGGPGIGVLVHLVLITAACLCILCPTSADAVFRGGGRGEECGWGIIGAMLTGWLLRLSAIGSHMCCRPRGRDLMFYLTTNSDDTRKVHVRRISGGEDDEQLMEDIKTSARALATDDPDPGPGPLTCRVQGPGPGPVLPGPGPAGPPEMLRAVSTPNPSSEARLPVAIPRPRKLARSKSDDLAAKIDAADAAAAAGRQRRTGTRNEGLIGVINDPGASWALGFDGACATCDKGCYPYPRLRCWELLTAGCILASVVILVESPYICNESCTLIAQDASMAGTVLRLLHLASLLLSICRFDARRLFWTVGLVVLLVGELTAVVILGTTHNNQQAAAARAALMIVGVAVLSVFWLPRLVFHARFRPFLTCRCRRHQRDRRGSSDAERREHEFSLGLAGRGFQTGDIFLTGAGPLDAVAFFTQCAVHTTWGHVGLIVRDPLPRVRMLYAVGYWLTKMRLKERRMLHGALLAGRREAQVRARSAAKSGPKSIFKQKGGKMSEEQARLEAYYGVFPALDSTVASYIAYPDTKKLKLRLTALTVALVRALTDADVVRLAARSTVPGVELVSLAFPSAGRLLSQRFVNATTKYPIKPPRTPHGIYVLEAIKTGCRMVSAEAFLDFWYLRRHDRVAWRPLYAKNSATTTRPVLSVAAAEQMVAKKYSSILGTVWGGLTRCEGTCCAYTRSRIRVRTSASASASASGSERRLRRGGTGDGDERRAATGAVEITSRNAYVCSSYVTRSLQELGLVTPNVEPTSITPGDFGDDDGVPGAGTGADFFVGDWVFGTRIYVTTKRKKRRRRRSVRAGPVAERRIPQSPV